MNRKENLKHIEEDLNKLNFLFLTNKKKEVLEEEVLNLLGEIEEKIGEIIGNKKERTSKEKEDVFQRYINTNDIDLDYISIEDNLDKLINRVYNEVTKRKKKLGFDIFKAGNIDFNGEGESKIEFKTAQKEKIFLRVLYKKGYNSSNIDQSEEELNPERKRQIPYQIFHLKKEDNKNTVLLCDEIGQATFVYEGIIDPSIFQLIEKGEAIGDSKALKIIYRKSTYETNLELALDDKLSYEEKEEKIVNEEEEVTDEKMEVSQVEVIKYFKEEKETEEDSYNYWIKLNYTQIGEIKYKDKKIRSLSTITGWENENNVKIQIPSGYQEFISWIFGREIFTGKEVIKYFKKIKKTEEDSYNYWMGLKVNQILEIKYKGKKIRSLSTITGWKNENKAVLNTPSLFQEFISWLFNREKIEITGEEVIKYFKEEKETEEESYNYWIGLNNKQIAKIKYKDKKIRSLSTITGWENKNNVSLNNPSGYQEFISGIFNREKIEITGEEVIKYFKKIKQTEEDSYNYWRGLTKKQIKNIEYRCKKITSISTIIGWENKNNVKLQNSSGFQEFISWVFGRE